MSKTGGLISLKLAAEILGCGTSTLRTWDKNGTLKAVRTPGGQRRYRTQDLEKFQLEGAVPMLSNTLAKFKANRIEDVTICRGMVVVSSDDRIAFADHPPIYGIRVGSVVSTLTKGEYDSLRNAGATDVVSSDLHRMT
jgi:excisionase family DNA binding protein